MSNRIKALRTKLGLTQKELATRAGTSQQQIQRLETGQMAARLDIAAKVARALDSPVSVVFPGSTRAMGKVKKEVAREPRYLPSSEALTELAKAGIEADSLFWTFRVQLRGQTDALDFNVEPNEKRRLFGSVQGESNSDSGLSFVVFDSEGKRIGINLAHLTYCHFLYEAFGHGDGPKDDSDDDDAQVYLAGHANPITFNVDIDRGDPEDEDDVGSFRNIFYFMETHVDLDQRFYFEDGDGEDVFIRAADLALLSVPLWIVDPATLELDEDDDSEPAAQEAEVAPQIWTAR